MNPSALRDYYKPVKTNASTFFENAVSMTRLEVHLEWAALGKPVDRDQWYVGLSSSRWMLLTDAQGHDCANRECLYVYPPRLP